MAKDDVIGLSIGLDTSSLKAGLQDASRRIKEINATFFSETAGMEKWWENTEGLNAKLKQLTGTLDVQKAALGRMEKEYEELLKTNDKNSKVATDLRTSILKQKGEIAKTEKQLGKYEKALEEADKEQKDLAKSTDKTTKELKEQDSQVDDTGDGFTVLKGIVANLAASIITGLVGALGRAIEESKQLNREMGFLQTTAKNLSVDTKDVEKAMGKVVGVFNDTGAAVEGMNNLMTAGFKGDALDNITDQLLGASIKWKDTLKFEALSDSLQEALGSKGQSVTGAFAELIERAGGNLEDFTTKLQNANTEAERQNIVFDELAKYGLKDVYDGYVENNEALYDNTKAMFDNQQASAELGEELLPLDTLFKEIKTSIIKSTIPAMEKLSPKIVEMVDSIKEALKDGLTADEIGDMIFDLVDNAIDFVDFIVKSFEKFVKSFSAALPDLAKQLSEKVPLIIEEIADSLNNNIPIIIDSFLTLITSVQEITPSITKTFLESLVQIIMALSESIKQNLPLIIDAIIAVINGIVEMLPELIAVLVEVLPDIIDAIVTFLVENGPVVQEAATKLLNAIIDAIGVIVEEVDLTELIDTIVSSIIKAIPRLFSSGVELMGGAIKGMLSTNDNFGDLAHTIMTNLLTKIGLFDEDFEGSGKSIMQGIYDGILAKWRELGSKIESFGQGIVKKFKDVFGIESPSKVMKAEIGYYIGEGVGEGVIESLPVVKRDINKFNKQVLDGFSVDTPDFNLGGNSTGSSAVTTNNRSFVQNIYTSKRPSVDEIYRRTGNLLDLDKVVNA